MNMRHAIILLIVLCAFLFCDSHAFIRGMGVRNDGDLLVADSHGDVLRFNPRGKLKSSQDFSYDIRTFNIGKKNKQYLTLDHNENSLQLFSPNADLLTSFFISGEDSVRITPGSSLVLTYDRNGDRVSVYDMSGQLISSIEGFNHLSDMASDSNGRVYLSFWDDSYVHVYTKKLVFRKKWGGSLPLIKIYNMYLDNYTNRMYITDGENEGVHVYNRKTGNHLFSLDQSLFDDPGRVAVTPKKNSLKRFIYVQNDKDVLKFKHGGKFMKRFEVVN